MKTYTLLLLTITCTPAFCADTNSITLSEFNKIKSYFIESGCGNEKFLSSTQELNLSPTYIDDAGTPKKITLLSKDSICLLSRSNYTRVRYTITENGKTSNKSSEKYPTNPNANIHEILFKIPPKIAKECDDDTVSAFAIYFRKKDGKIQREIILNNDLLSCNEGLLEIPKNYKYKN